VTLLFGQNLSHRLVTLLADTFPGSVHVRSVGLGIASDEEVWSYALENGLAIVSKDSNFASFSAVRGQPPKVIWIRRGNCTTEAIESLIRSHQEVIAAFLDDPKSDCLQML
jgi:predicted nuclease of predicted toxin-antitoxin system